MFFSIVSYEFINVNMGQKSLISATVSKENDYMKKNVAALFCSFC